MPVVVEADVAMRAKKTDVDAEAERTKVEVDAEEDLPALPFCSQMCIYAA